MRLHANARTCPKSRQEIVRRFLAGRSRECLSREFAVSTPTISKWVARYRAEGELGLIDRSSAPHRVHRTDPGRVDAVLALRRLRFTAPEIAEVLELPVSTTSALLKQHGLGRLGRIGLEPAQRYERERPGIRRDMVRWEFVHIAIDDCTRLAYAEVLADETGRTAAGFLHRATVFFGRHGNHSRARTDRQRLGLSLRDPRTGLPPARHPAPANPAAPPTDQRQSRTLHPHDDQRLGLRRDLRLKRPTHRSP